jgi:predicted component of type VI protein secretion system
MGVISHYAFNMALVKIKKLTQSKTSAYLSIIFPTLLKFIPYSAEILLAPPLF